MYKKIIIPTKYGIKRNVSEEGERIEDKIDRMTHNNEPISDSAPLLYSERKDGVLPETDIRTDPWEIAIDGIQARNTINLNSRNKTNNLETTDSKPVEGTQASGSNDTPAA